MFQTLKLGEMCTLRAGSAFKTHLQGNKTGQYPFIKVSDMNLPSNEVCIRDANNWIEEGIRAEIKAKPLPAGTTVFAKIGEALRQNRVRLLIMDTIVDNNMMGAIPNRNAVDPKFFYYLLSDFNIAGTATGTALPYLTVSTLVESTFQVPPLPIQQRIAGILSPYDELIESSQRRIKILESMASALYREWFVHFRFPGHESVPSVLSPLSEIPKGWQAKPLADLADLSLGKMLDQRKNRGQPRRYLANVNVRWGDFDLSELREMRFEADELETYGLRRGDIVMCEGGEPGRCAIWMKQIEGMMIQKALHRIRCRDDMHFVFLYHSLRHLGEVGALAALFTGATIKHLPQEKLARVKVVQPPSQLVAMFAGVAEPIESLIHTLQSRVQTLRRTRDLLLPRLLSGQIDAEALPA